jgi:YD repeat-containing protein
LGKKRQGITTWLSGPLLAFILATSVLAQGTITFQYFYDDLGQLSKVVDSTGVIIEYIYDAAGNILQIKRSSIAPGALAIFNFSPQQGAVNGTVTLEGQGFGTTPSGNTVRFNGTVATVISATSTRLVATVPFGATTGPISVTVGGSTATSSGNFTVVPLPSITSISPKAALSNSTISSFQVTGTNLNGSTFSFLPTFTPSAITVASAVIDPSGSSAALSLIINANAAGSFVLVATIPAGSSDGFPSAGNSFRVFNLAPTGDGDGDGLTNADEVARGTDPSNRDTDGDGFPDGLEVALGSNPLSAASLPNANPPGEAVGLTFSLLNGVSPAPTQPTLREADSLTFSLLNGVSPAPTQPTLREADSLTFSLLNGVSPAPAQPSLREADSLTLSLLNGGPPTQPTQMESVSLLFSAENLASSPQPAGPDEKPGTRFGAGRSDNGKMKPALSRRRRSHKSYTTKGKSHAQKKP